MIALAALSLATGAATGATLHPILDKPYTLIVADERSVGGRVRHFTAKRRIVFHRGAGALLAEVTLLTVMQDIGGSAGRRFEAALAILRDRIVRLHLSDDGTLIAIDDEAALDALVADSLRIAGTRPGGAPMNLPSPVARDEIASMLMPVIAGADAARVPGTHPVVVSSRPPAVTAPLSGSESVTLGSDALLHFVVHASSAGDGRTMSLDRERSVDRDHGLVMGEDEVQTIRIGEGVQVIRRRMTLTPPV